MAGIDGITNLPRRFKALVVIISVAVGFYYDDFLPGLYMAGILIFGGFIGHWLFVLIGEDKESEKKRKKKKKKQLKKTGPNTPLVVAVKPKPVTSTKPQLVTTVKPKHVSTKPIEVVPKPRDVVTKPEEVVDTKPKEYTEEISFTKGTEFERFVKDNLFPESKYTMMHQTPSLQDNKERYNEATLNPDLKFRSKKTGKEFWVEVKYRKDYFKGRVEWCKHYQLPRYKKLDKEMPVYLVLGIGNTPSLPKEIAFARVSKLKYKHLFPNEVGKLTIDTSKPIQL